MVVVARWAAPLFATDGPSWYTQTVYPLEHTGAIRDAARRYDLDPALVAAVIYAESRFDEHALSSQGAVGLMQVLPETARADRRRVRRRRRSPRTTSRTRGSTSATGATTCGRRWTPTTATCAPPSPRTTPAWAPSPSGGRTATGAGLRLRDIPYPETRAYVKKVLEARRVYRETYGDRLDGR